MHIYVLPEMQVLWELAPDLTTGSRSSGTRLTALFQNIADFTIWLWNWNSKSWEITSSITHWMLDWFPYSLVKKLQFYLKKNGSFISNRFCVKEIWNFLPWISPWRSQIWIAKITKPHNGWQTENNEPLRASNWLLALPVTVWEKEQKTLSTISMHYAVRFLQTSWSLIRLPCRLLLGYYKIFEINK